MPGDVIQITRTGALSEGTSTSKTPTITDEEIAAGEKGKEDYLARVISHINKEDTQTTSGKIETFTHPPIVYNGDLNHLVQQVTQAFQDEGFVPSETIEDANIDSANEKALLKTQDKLFE